MARAIKVGSKETFTLRFTATSIERWPLDQLLPYARNARTHSDEQVSQIARRSRNSGS
jgi:hypothetical protein